MASTLAGLLIFTLLAGPDGAADGARSYLFQPAYVVDDLLRAPAEPYLPQPGDIYLATDSSCIIRLGHAMALSGAPHHSGIVICQPNGQIGILESGPFNTLHVAIVDFHHDLEKHETRGEKVWIRRRRTPLTPEQSAELTKWAAAQNGKWFAGGRMMLQLTQLRTRGPLRTYFMGGPAASTSVTFARNSCSNRACILVSCRRPPRARRRHIRATYSSTPPRICI